MIPWSMEKCPEFSKTYHLNRAGKSAFICERAREEGFRNQGKIEEGARMEKIESPTILGKQKHKEKNN